MKSLLWFSDLKYAFRTPTWKSLALSLTLLAGYYFSLDFMATNYVDFDFQIPGFVIYSLGYVIAILFYFRLNNSYYRWNDGHKSLTSLRALNEAFIIKSKAYLVNHPDDLQYFTILIKNHYRALADHVRGFQNHKNMIEPTLGDKDQFESSQHLATRVNALLANHLNTLFTQDKLTRIQFLDLTRLMQKNTELVSTCEALQDSPPPRTYIIHIRGFILAYAMMIPFGFLDSLQAWMLLFLLIFFYFYAGLEMISDELEDPFGFDVNDIPVTELTKLLEKRVDDVRLAKHV